MGSSDTAELLPRVGTGDGGGGGGRVSIAAIGITHMHVCSPTPPAIFHTKTHKENVGLVYFDKNSCVSRARGGEAESELKSQGRIDTSRLRTRCHAGACIY